jgi:pyrroloquinoline quinone biosynthesis protein D
MMQQPLSPRRVRPVLSAESRPALPRHVRFRHDPARDRWVLLAPERVMVPDDTAVAVLQRIDGERTVANIAADLALTYAADLGLILEDSIAMLQDLADKGFLVVRTVPGDV